jgi:pimeloyl-ACP methyl ester carboxylesterase
MMFMTPAAVLGSWLRGILSIALLFLGVWLIAKWYDSRPKVVTYVEVVENNHENLETAREANPPDASRSEHLLTPVERITSWRPGMDRESAMFFGGLLILVWSTSGGLLLRYCLLLKAGEPIPELPPGEVLRLTRPDGTELHVEIHGPTGAHTLVMTHGWSLSHREWAYMQREWGQTFRLVVWDLPGLGKSTAPANHDFSLEKFAHDLHAVVDVSGAGPVTLVGHSIGGMTILTFCRLFPSLLGSKITKLVLIHTSYRNPLTTMANSWLYTALQKPLIEPMLYLQIWLSPLVRVMNWMSYRNGSIQSSSARSGFSGKETHSDLDFVARYSLVDSPAVLARGTLGMLAYDATQTLPTIPIPVLVIGAERDPVTSIEASQKIQRDIPLAQLETVTSAKHFGLIEFRPEVAQMIATFCRGNPTHPTRE